MQQKKRNVVFRGLFGILKRDHEKWVKELCKKVFGIEEKINLKSSYQFENSRKKYVEESMVGEEASILVEKIFQVERKQNIYLASLFTRLETEKS